MRLIERSKLLIVIFSTIILASFTAGETNYKVDTKASKVHWLGRKTTGQHEGDVPVKSGTLKTNAGIPLSGEFVLDLGAITCTDIADPDDNKDLVNHLKGDDFFGVDKYPTALLTVKKFEKRSKPAADEPNYEATADLTIKGIKNEIKFFVKADLTGEAMHADAKITIDRTKWNISYKSKTVFGSLGDKFIYDDVSFDVKLILQKQK